ncbi:MAG: hypothetical protein KIT56_06365 [Gammaproteobacteria bacterium]|nr:hypothetical protein [Gammaproteobacteria bacterium]MCW5583488.1 hypothetical protein [Gammaproteobacteria bacterium]
MKMRYFMLVAAVVITFLGGCKNRIEEYEPYSAFDERMASAERGGPNFPDDQMPPSMEDPYAYNGDQGYSLGDQLVDQPRMAERKSYNSNSGQSDVEVPFTDSRSPKHAANIGAL